MVNNVFVTLTGHSSGSWAKLDREYGCVDEFKKHSYPEELHGALMYDLEKTCTTRAEALLYMKSIDPF